MIRINLLPVREARKRASQRQSGLLLGGAVVAGLFLAFLIHMTVQARLSSARSRIRHVEQELAKVEKTLGDVEEFRKKKEDIQRKLTVIAELQRSRTAPVILLDEIATRIPERVWLTDLSLKKGLLELSGYGLDNEVIAAFMTSLGQSAHLSNVELLETKLEDRKGLKLNRFKVRSRHLGSSPAVKEGDKQQERRKGRRRGRKRGG